MKVLKFFLKLAAICLNIVVAAHLVKKLQEDNDFFDCESDCHV